MATEGSKKPTLARSGDFTKFSSVARTENSTARIQDAANPTQRMMGHTNCETHRFLLITPILGFPTGMAMLATILSCRMLYILDERDLNAFPRRYCTTQTYVTYSHTLPLYPRARGAHASREPHPLKGVTCEQLLLARPSSIFVLYICARSKKEDTYRPYIHRNIVLTGCSPTPTFSKITW